MDATPLPAKVNLPGEISQAEAAQLAAIRIGDAAAFEQLYSKYFAPLWQFAYTYVHSYELAEEAVHDVFTAIWIGRANWQVHSTLNAYMYGAVRNRSLKLLKRDSIDRRHVTTDTATVFMSAPIPRPDVHTELTELERCIAETIRHLPERQRSAITFRIVNDMPHTEIAGMLNVSAPAISKLIEKAQNKIRKFCLGG